MIFQVSRKLWHTNTSTAHRTNQNIKTLLKKAPKKPEEFVVNHGSFPDSGKMASAPTASEKTAALKNGPVAPAIVSKSPYPELDGRYELLEAVGDGAFSKVHKGINLSTGEFVAIKVIHKKNISAKQHQSIQKEMSIMRKLHHENIVRLVDTIQSDDHYFLVLEYCQGGEIFKQIINFTYFSEDLSRHIIVQVALAVKYLHEEIGVAHRDIKPENLLFIPCDYKPRPQKEFEKSKRKSDDDDKIDEGYFQTGVGGGGIGVVKLADFGLSKVLWNTTTKTPCGTAGYTAPEILKVESYDKSVDLWAIGCVLYTLLCGFPPFYDEKNDPSKLIDKSLKGQFEFLSPWWDEIGNDAKSLVKNLLNVNPTKRYTIDQLLSDPWITKKYKPKDKRDYDENANLDYFPDYNQLMAETNKLEVTKKPASPQRSPNMTPTVATPNRVNHNSVVGEELIAREKKYRDMFAKNIEVQRVKLENEMKDLSQLQETEEEYEGQPREMSVAHHLEDPENSLMQALSEVTFGKSKKSNIPRTPCPTKMTFSEEEEDDTVKDDEFDNESSDSSSEESLNSHPVEKTRRKPVPPILDIKQPRELDGFHLSMDNSSMLERRRKTSIDHRPDK